MATSSDVFFGDVIDVVHVCVIIDKEIMTNPHIWTTTSETNTGYIFYRWENFQIDDHYNFSLTEL